MLIAIISDIHDNLENLKTTLVWCKQNKIAKLICCGDITNPETLSFLSNNFSGKIFLVSGNAEIYERKNLKALKNVFHYGESGIIIMKNLHIGFCHEPTKIKNVKALSGSPLNFIFYGHTHKPWIKKEALTIIANPGTIAGVFSQATFAILETSTKKLTLKLIANL